MRRKRANAARGVGLRLGTTSRHTRTKNKKWSARRERIGLRLSMIRDRLTPPGIDRSSKD